jgi:hypothetical protein
MFSNRFPRALARAVALACLAIATRAQPAVAGPLEEMISPVSIPTINEDPRVTTELRPMYMYTSIANSFVTGGGDYSVAAAQLRVALTDRIGFIATKDGYIWLSPNEVVKSGDGWANLAFGFKGSLLRDEMHALVATVGLRYEAPSGSQDVLQGKGDGLLNPFLSVAKGFDDFHAQLYAGPRIAISGRDSSFFDLGFHMDYRFFERFYPLVELNWIRVIDAGSRIPISQEGYDLVDLGASKSGGSSVSTIAMGFRYRIIDDLDFGVTGEFPWTTDEDIFGWRVTTDFIWRPMGWSALF